MSDLLLGAHSGDSEHRQASVVEFPRLHVGEFRGICRFESEKVESDISWIISSPETKERVWLDRFFPTHASPKSFGDTDRKSQETK